MSNATRFDLSHLAKPIASCGLCVASCAFAADLSPVAKAEVDQLLTRLASSGCKFQRNGAWYSPVEARAHINKKYQYLLDKGKLSSTEDFIAGTATQSSMSGKAYQVQCADKAATPSAQWMGEQLQELRSATPKGH